MKNATRFTLPLLGLLVLLLLATGCGYSRFSRRELPKYAKMNIKNKTERALFYMNKEEYRKAIAIYQLIAQDKDATPKHTAWAQYEIGFCYRMMGKYAIAVTTFEKLLKDFPQEEAKPARLLAETQIKKIKSGKHDGL